MVAPEQSIFRAKAIKRYQQRQEQGIMLRVSCPSALIFFWVFLFVLVGMIGFTWSIQVPVQIQGQGVIIRQGTMVAAILFFSPEQQASLRVGETAAVSIGSSQLKVSGSVERVDSTIISPDEARSRFNLQGGLAQVITGPSITVVIPIGTSASAQIYAGSLCRARLQVGSQSVLSFLPGLHHLLGR